jgi:hypothetical protein
MGTQDVTGTEELGARTVPEREATDDDTLDDEHADSTGELRSALRGRPPLAAGDAFGTSYEGLAGLLEAIRRKLRPEIGVRVQHPDALRYGLAEVRKAGHLLKSVYLRTRRGKHAHCAQWRPFRVAGDLEG